MVPKERKVDSALELDGSKVCVQTNTTTELNLEDYFRANNMKYQALKFGKVDDVFKAYESTMIPAFITPFLRRSPEPRSRRL